MVETTTTRKTFTPALENGVAFRLQHSLIELIDLVNVKANINAYSEVPEGPATIHQAWSGDAIAGQYYLPKGESAEVLAYWRPEEREVHLRWGDADLTLRPDVWNDLSVDGDIVVRGDTHDFGPTTGAIDNVMNVRNSNVSNTVNLVSYSAGSPQTDATIVSSRTAGSLELKGRTKAILGFTGTDVRFSFYFPAAEDYEGRFAIELEPFSRE